MEPIKIDLIKGARETISKLSDEKLPLYLGKYEEMLAGTLDTLRREAVLLIIDFIKEEIGLRKFTKQ